MPIFIGIMCASSGLKCLSTKPCISTRMDDLLACFIFWCAPFNVLLFRFFFSLPLSRFSPSSSSYDYYCYCCWCKATLAFHIMVYVALSRSTSLPLNLLHFARSICLFTFVFVHQPECNTSLCSLQLFAHYKCEWRNICKQKYKIGIGRFFHHTIMSGFYSKRARTFISNSVPQPLTAYSEYQPNRYHRISHTHTHTHPLSFPL